MTNANPTQARDDIRTNMKARRQALCSSDLELASQLLLENCKPLLQEAKAVAGYQAMSGEISLEPVFSFCHEQGIETLLPIMHNQSLLFAPFSTDTPFSTKKYGIQEPDVPAHALLKPQDLDIVLLPLVAFDQQLNRIGMGGGFYDRSFEFRKGNNDAPLLIGVAHSFQEVENAHPEEWDVPLDRVITDR